MFKLLLMLIKSLFINKCFSPTSGTPTDPLLVDTLITNDISPFASVGLLTCVAYMQTVIRQIRLVASIRPCLV